MTQQNPVVLLTDAEAFIGPALVAMFMSRGAKVLAADPSFVDAGAVSTFAAAHPGVTPVFQTTPAETVARALAHEATIDVLCTGGVHPANRTTAGELSENVTRPYFEKLGFQIEGRMPGRVRMPDGSADADLAMALVLRG